MTMGINSIKMSSINPLTIVILCSASLFIRLSNGQLQYNASNALASSKIPATTFQQLLHRAQPLGSSELAEDTQDGDTLSSLMLKTYIRVNSMRAYHLDLHSYRPEAPYVGDPAFVDSEKPEHKTRCWGHLQHYGQLLKSFNELDPVLDKNSIASLKLADTFGRPESGILEGNQFWVGSYAECLAFKHQVSATNGQYCLGVMQFPNWNPQDSLTSIKVGLCLPDTCTSSMINEDPEMLKQVEWMSKSQFGAMGRPFNKLKLRSVYCLPHKSSQIRQYSGQALAFFAVVGFFVITCILATMVDYFQTKLSDKDDTKPTIRTRRNIIVESFSLTRNLDKFLHVKTITESQPVEGTFDEKIFLDSMAGLKCIGLCWIICAHTFLVTPIPTKNMIGLDKITNTYMANVYLTAHLLVDTFFALSGLLASYLIFKGDIDTIKVKEWIVLTVHRYWRLTPIYLICYWFTKSVGAFINDGPMWDYMTAEQSPRLNCARESWLQAFLHLSDFKSPKDHCVPFAWFIANGIKFWLVTPFFLTVISHSIKRGYALIAAVIAANIALVTWLAMTSEVDVMSVIEFRPESANNMLNNMGETYTRPYSRIGAYLIGLLAGHMMYSIEKNGVQVKLSKNTKILIWTLFTVTVISLTFILKIANGFKIDEAAIAWVFGISSGLVRPLWALCTCWLTFALATGQIPWAAKFLSATCWRILVKLSFTAYLVQAEVIAQLYLSTINPEMYTYSDIFCKSIVTIALTILASVLVVLFLEYPLIGIEELILPKRSRNAVPKATEVENGKVKDITTEKLKNS